MKKVIVIRSKDFKEKKEYDIQCGEEKDISNGVYSLYCTIRASKKPPIQCHYYIEAYHTLGGGMGGWDSYTEDVGIAHGKKDIPKQLRLTAVSYARKLAKRLGASLEDRL